MSKKEKITITCPKCKNEHPFIIWSSINTTLDPEMKAAVKDKSAFLFTCPDCGEKTYVDYGTLYHQMEDRIMIHYAQSDESAEEVLRLLNEDGPNGIFKDMRADNYLIRIARSQNELREKIEIFDAGLDDRIVELVKLLVLVKYQEANPGHDEIALYYRKNEGKDIIEIYADGEYSALFEIPEDLYEKFMKDYSKVLPDMRKDEPYIDREWAIEHLGAAKERSSK